MALGNSQHTKGWLVNSNPRLHSWGHSTGTRQVNYGATKAFTMAERGLYMIYGLGFSPLAPPVQTRVLYLLVVYAESMPRPPLWGETSPSSGGYADSRTIWFPLLPACALCGLFLRRYFYEELLIGKKTQPLILSCETTKNKHKPLLHGVIFRYLKTAIISFPPLPSHHFPGLNSPCLLILSQSEVTYFQVHSPF